MLKIILFLKKIALATLATVILGGCTTFGSGESVTDAKNLSSTEQATDQSMLTPFIVAEWVMGNVRDMDWSPDSKMLAVNHLSEGGDSSNSIQAFDIESLNRMWVVENSLAMDLVFTPDGQFIVESNIFAPFFYWRSVEQGEVVRQGEFTDISQVKPGDCNGGGQIILLNARENTAMIVDYGNLLGPRTHQTIIIRQLDLQTGRCENLIEYQGSFDLFDLNSNGTILAFGGDGENDSVVIWDVDKQEEICRASKVDFGRFVPKQNTLAVVREQKIIFIDASTCQELRELNLAPSVNYETWLFFNPDGNQFAIASDSIQIVNTSTGEFLAQIPFPENAIPYSSKSFFSGIKFSPDGRYLAVTYSLLESIDSSKVQLWQLTP